MEVKRGGNLEPDGIGEFETKNEAEVVANDANPRRTGVYGASEPAVAIGIGPSCASRSVVSSCFRFHAL
jgi:hypothetical protein